MAVSVAMIFLISSSGYVVYKSYCACFGKEQVSIFVTPGTCESEDNHHHKHDAVGMETANSANECHECASHDEECSCDAPEAIFFKLQNQITNEEVKFTKVLPLELFVAELTVFTELLNATDSFEKEEFCSNPPPIVPSTLEFLIQIQQLKIPHIA